jgi:uncharacterized protein with PIN domain
VNREELKTRLMAEAEAAMDDLLARKPEAAEIKLRDIEQLAIGSSQDFREAVLEQLVKDSQDEALEVMNCPQCGQRMHDKGQRAKTLITEAGEVRVERTYYYCAACKHGVFPPG